MALGTTKTYLVTLPDGSARMCLWEDLEGRLLPKGAKIVRIEKNFYGDVLEERDIPIEDNRAVDEDAEG